MKNVSQLANIAHRNTRLIYQQHCGIFSNIKMIQWLLELHWLYDVRDVCKDSRFLRAIVIYETIIVA